MSMFFNYLRILETLSAVNDKNKMILGFRKKNEIFINKNLPKINGF